MYNQFTGIWFSQSVLGTRLGNLRLVPFSTNLMEAEEKRRTLHRKEPATPLTAKRDDEDKHISNS